MVRASVGCVGGCPLLIVWVGPRDG